MEFNRDHQHGVAQLALLQDMLNRDALSDRECGFVLSQLAVYGLDSFEQCFKQWLPAMTHAAMRQFALRKQQEWQAVRKLPELAQILRNKALTAHLLALDKPYYERGRTQPNKLLIVFTTMYNNFYFANPALLAFLRGLGVSLLVLKDSTPYNYLNGIPEFGKSIDEAARALAGFIAKQAIDQTYICGFSSSGYASLLMSSKLDCDGYLGFSVCSDLSAHTTLPLSKYYTPAVAAAIDASVKLNLAARFSAAPPAYQCRIIYGEHSNIDQPHAQNLVGIANIEVAKVSNAGHVVLAPLFINGSLLTLFEQLVG